MIEFDLEEMFKVKIVDKESSDVEDLKQFFAERFISNNKIAEVLGVFPQQVGHWFNGRRTTPAKWKKELEDLRGRFVEWEEEHDAMFNHEKEREPDLPDCPYAEHGLKFGIDYEVYDVCDNCSIKLECGNENQRQATSHR